MTLYESKFWTKSYDAFVQPNIHEPKTDLGTLFDDAMSRFPDSTAIYFMKSSFTYKYLKDKVHRFATYLQKNGLNKGDRVIINLPNCPQYIVAHLGTLLAGGVCSGCSPILSADEMAYQINNSEAKFFVTLDAIFAKVLPKILPQLRKLETIITTNISDYMGLNPILKLVGKKLGKIPSGKVHALTDKTVIDYKKVIKTGINLKTVRINPLTDLALIQYTGGTTGWPKGTELTHANIISNLLQIEQWLNVGRGGKTSLSAFPLFHLAGLAFCHITLYLSNSQVLIANPRDTNHIIKEIISKKPNLIANVPTLYLMIMNNKLVKKIPKKVLDNVEVYISGAAPFPAEAIKSFEKKMQADNKVLEVYGMTETSPIITMNPFKGEKKIGTVGLPVASTEIKLVDLETGEPVPLGSPGEICCRGPQVTRGYYKKPEETNLVLSDGWLRTGDVGVMDEKGYIKIVDRAKDMLIVGGYKVYSVHVEDILTKQKDIELVAIIGEKDPERPGSEIVKAVIKLKEGIEATDGVKAGILTYAQSHLSKYEVPKIWEYRKELPVTPIGKILKRELRSSK